MRWSRYMPPTAHAEENRIPASSEGPTGPTIETRAGYRGKNAARSEYA
jgi:hypothetical protein